MVVEIEQCDGYNIFSSSFYMAKLTIFKKFIWIKAKFFFFSYSVSSINGGRNKNKNNKKSWKNHIDSIYINYVINL